MIEDGVLFCGEPWKYVWTEEQVTELDRVLSNMFKEQKPLDQEISKVLFDNIQDLYA